MRIAIYAIIIVFFIGCQGRPLPPIDDAIQLCTAVAQAACDARLNDCATIEDGHLRCRVPFDGCVIRLRTQLDCPSVTAAIPDSYQACLSNAQAQRCFTDVAPPTCINAFERN